MPVWLKTKQNILPSSKCPSIIIHVPPLASAMYLKKLHSKLKFKIYNWGFNPSNSFSISWKRISRNWMLPQEKNSEESLSPLVHVALGSRQNLHTHSCSLLIRTVRVCVTPFRSVISESRVPRLTAWVTAAPRLSDSVLSLPLKVSP